MKRGSASSWELGAQHAELRFAECAARLELPQPAAGLMRWTTTDGTPLVPGMQLLGFELPTRTEGSAAPLAEVYVRGTDLIATYGDGLQTPFRWQVYWRAVAERYPGALAAVELVASVQTSMLHSQPERSVAGVLPTTGGWQWRREAAGEMRIEPLACPPVKACRLEPPEAVGCLRLALCGPTGERLALDYVELVHPADFSATRLESVPPAAETAVAAIRLSQRLWTVDLEKGVILRSRVLGLLVPAEMSPEAIAEYHRAFAAEDLPLTT